MNTHVNTHTRWALAELCVYVAAEDEVKTPGRLQLLLRGAFRDSRWISPRTELQRPR